MNCKEGDLALIVKTKHAGTMVTCIRLEDVPAVSNNVGLLIPPGKKWRGVTWLVDRVFKWENKEHEVALDTPHFPDEYLLPIRPLPDEQDVETTQEIEA